MKKLFGATAALALFAAAPVSAADTVQNNNEGKPGSSANPTPTPDTKSNSATDADSSNSAASGTSTGVSGASKDLPGSSDSNKKDSSLSTNGSAPKQ